MFDELVVDNENFSILFIYDRPFNFNMKLKIPQTFENKIWTYSQNEIYKLSSRSVRQIS